MLTCDIVVMQLNSICYNHQIISTNHSIYYNIKCLHIIKYHIKQFSADYRFYYRHNCTKSAVIIFHWMCCRVWNHCGNVTGQTHKSYGKELKKWVLNYILIILLVHIVTLLCSLFLYRNIVCLM